MAKLARWSWYRQSVQRQLLVAFVLINLIAGIATGAIVIYNAHRATMAEIASSMELAERVIQGTVDEIARKTAGIHLPETPSLRVLETLGFHIRNLRHVRVVVADASGRRLSEAPASANGDQEAREAPRWFRALFRFDNLSREVQVTLGGRQHIGTVIITGQPDDEIAEVWGEVSDLAVVVLITNAVMIALFYLALGRILRPLTSLGAGLQELEQGRFGYRLPSPEVREVASIVDRFNALASALDAARADNVRLNRRLVRAHDDERKQIATELHDELGPCVFGLRASALSLRRQSEALPPEFGEPMRGRVQALVDICERIQTANRRALRRIRPVAIGQAALADVVERMVADLQKDDPDHIFQLRIGQLRRGYGECVDLTAYRCVQEALTNALRHAEAKTITVTIEEATVSRSRSGQPAATPVLSLAVADDGRGVAPGTPPGLGLTSLQERVQALGGTFAISSRPSGGTSLEIAIPVDEREACASTLDRDDGP